MNCADLDLTSSLTTKGRNQIITQKPSARMAFFALGGCG
jgi:hypothetical protein